MAHAYVALLRGINVGTTGRIRMDTLKQLMENAGFKRVSTYIQSGNLLFDSQLPEQDAKETIERALKEGAAITTTAVLRSVAEFSDIIEQCPFSSEELESAALANTEGESFYVCLPPQQPAQDALKKLEDLPAQDDRFVVSGRTIYLLLRQSIRVSKLAIRLQRLFPQMTVRNWSTMMKLNELAKQQNGAES